MNTLSRFVTAILVALTLSACLGTGTSSVVGFASVSGNGDVRVSDDGYAFAMGGLTGSTGMYVIGSGFPLTVPLDIEDGTWVEFVNAKPVRTGVIGADPIPWKAHFMYRPGFNGSPPEWEQVLVRMGYDPASVPIEPSPYDNAVTTLPAEPAP